MKNLAILFALIIAFNLNAQKLDTLTYFSQMTTDKGYYKAPNGKIYKFKVEKAEWTDGEEQTTRDISSTICEDSLYTGEDRAAAKTSVLKTKPITVATVSDLIRQLPKDSVMRKKVKKASPRIPEEMKNIRLKKDTYLYAFAKENDADYHIIIGDHLKSTKATFFNVEISGLPANSSNQILNDVRKVFETQFKGLCPQNYITFTENPIKIDIQGSLFFDISHSKGQVGPSKLKPQTNWELHPVSKIKFL